MKKVEKDNLNLILGKLNNINIMMTSHIKDYQNSEIPKFILNQIDYIKDHFDQAQNDDGMLERKTVMVVLNKLGIMSYKQEAIDFIFKYLYSNDKIPND